MPPLVPDNPVARAKAFAVYNYWEPKAQGNIQKFLHTDGWRRYPYLARGAASWAFKQAAKLGPETRTQLALDVGSVALPFVAPVARGLGLLPGASNVGKIALRSEQLLQQAHKTGEVVIKGSGKMRYVVTAAGEVASPAPNRALFALRNFASKLPAPVVQSLKYAKNAYTLGSRVERGVQFQRHQATCLKSVIPQPMNRATAPGIKVGSHNIASLRNTRILQGKSFGALRTAPDLNKLRQPTLSKGAQKEIMRKGVFVPGVWGSVISRSSPAKHSRPMQNIKHIGSLRTTSPKAFRLQPIHKPIRSAALTSKPTRVPALGMHASKVMRMHTPMRPMLSIVRSAPVRFHR
jgi:hypothetical protein